MDEAQFKAIVAILIVVVCLLAVVSVILAITYAVMANRLSRRVRRTVSSMEAMLAESIAEATRREEQELIPPMRIELAECQPSGTCKLAEKVHQWLRKNEFKTSGTFRVDYDDEVLQTFLSEDSLIVAAIRRLDDAAECYVEFAMDLGDGQCAGVSNPPAASVPPQSDAIGQFHRARLNEDFDVLERMHLQARRIIDSEDVIPIHIDRVASFFEEAHATQMDWRIRNGGITEDEVRQAFAAQGSRCTDSELKTIQLRWQRAIDRHILGYSRLADGGRASESDLIVVHASSLPAHLQNRLQTAAMLDPTTLTGDVCRTLTADVWSEFHQLLERFEPREAVARLCPLMAQELRLELAEQLTAPVPADIYRVCSV